MGGVAKGLLRTGDGSSIIRRLLEQLAAAGMNDVVLSANDPQPYAEFGLPIVADVHADIGPMGGIQSVLTKLAPFFDYVLLLPCDLPNVAANDILKLVRACTAAPTRIVLAHTADGDQPLCAVVETAVLAEVNAAIAAGEYGVDRLWRSLGARLVEIEDDSRMINLNTPDDLRAWRDS